jgi:hypothetical protein
MIGCLIAAGLALFVLSRVHRHHRRWCGVGGYHRGWHGGWGGGWAGRGHHHHHHGGWHQIQLDDPAPGDEWERWPEEGAGQRHFIRAVLGRLGATRVQEKTIREALRQFRDEIDKLRGGELRRSQSELADALRRPTFDGVVLGEQFARHDSILEGARKSFVGLVARVHDALEPEQRAQLAKLVDRGPRFGWWH